MAKKYLKTNVSIFALMLTLGTLHSTVASADDMTYTGTEAEYDALTWKTNDGKRSVIPEGISGNTVTVSNPNNSGDFKEVYGVYGGYNSENSQDVSSNNVIVTGGKITKAISGGFSKNGNSVNNTVTISSDVAAGVVVTGGLSSYGNATDNTLNFKLPSSGQLTVDADVLAGGAVGLSSVATGNKLNIDGGVFNGEVRGAQVDQLNGSASNNEVHVKGGTFAKMVTGASASTADGNLVEISGGKFLNSIRAGNAHTANNNTVKIYSAADISDAKVDIAGAYADQKASGNTVLIERDENSSVVSGKVYGVGSNGVGFTQYDSNSVVLRGGRYNNMIAGAAVDKGNITNSRVEIIGADVRSDVFGGLTSSVSNNVNNNSVKLSGNTHVTGKVYGGYNERIGESSGNSVSLEDATVDGLVIGGYAGSMNKAINNTVTLTGQNVKVTGTVLGGYVVGNTTKSQEFDGNTLNLVHFRGELGGIQNFETYNWILPKNVINNDTLVHITGDEAVDLVNTKHVVSLENDGNRLNVGDKVTLIDKVQNGPLISNMEVKQGNFLIYDMKAEQQSTDGNGVGTYVLTAQNRSDTPSDNGENNNNSSNTSGNENNGSSASGNNDAGSNTSGNENNGSSASGNNDAGSNTSGNENNGSTASGNNDNNSHADENKQNASNGANSGSTENTGSNSDSTANENTHSGENKTPAGSNEANSNGSNDKNVVAGGNNTTTGDKHSDQMQPISSDQMPSVSSEPTVPTQPVAPTEPNKELAGRINPQTKAFSEGRAAALGFVNQGADLIAEAGIRAARSSVAEGASNAGQMNLTPFMVMNGGSSRYKTGSHVDVDGFNMVVGLATGFDLLNQHPVTIGAFFEYGRGTYNTYNSFETYASVHGDGDTHYTGGGILGRIEFAGTGLGWVKKLNADQTDGLYAEASFRAGKIDSDFDTNDILGGRGESSSYDSGANYYGLHGGVGYVLNFDERNSVDIYGRYLWTRIDSETVNVGRDRLRFDDADSSRIRVGARYTTVYNDQLKPYIGVAYEHEFDGEVAARAYGLKLNKPSLEGDTGIFEAGVTLKPISTIDALSVDVTGQGFVGQRQGGGGGLKIKYQF